MSIVYVTHRLKICRGTCACSRPDIESCPDSPKRLYQEEPTRLCDTCIGDLHHVSEWKVAGLRLEWDP
jgi:hypothetical protein